MMTSSDGFIKMISVSVGPNKAQFHVRKDLLVREPRFFSCALTGTFIEAARGRSRKRYHRTRRRRYRAIHSVCPLARHSQTCGHARETGLLRNACTLLTSSPIATTSRTSEMISLISSVCNRPRERFVSKEVFQVS